MRGVRLSVLVILLVTRAHCLIQVDFDFPEGSICESSAHTLTLSIPISCNAALLEVIEDGLPLDLVTLDQGAELGDLCHTYCTAPMRQVGEDCYPLKEMYQAIIAACDLNANKTKCFDVREWAWPVLNNCTVNATDPCTTECTGALTQAHSNMGCCLTSFLNTTQYNERFELWEECELSPPPPPCSQATPLTPWLLVIGILCILTLLAC